ncbi:MAG: M20 family metallopeptidase [Clostridia bacterium]|jgi:acetylornithine deacetylase/succinyl-diaminopimelate desuccinylase family protein|nr:M20 family metallopeptidase [Clostridia bacterium]MCI2000519.1 M20 family metallopeptidase [Clostridia bacterium]MCI2014974.1 M20 family metallopeptidase [Clostridia bacterium]
MDDREKVIKYIENNKDEIVRIASGLISIPSISGREDSNENYEKEANYLVTEFKKFGITAYKHALSPGGCNLVAQIPGTGNGKTLAMGGHYDVVAADEDDWKTDGGFIPTVKDGMLIGRGAADMKGGLAACFMALKAIKECGIKPKGNIQFVATVDEEIGGPYGMDFLVNAGIVSPDFFINAEQTEMKIIIAYKGCAWMEVKVKGVTAHGSRPSLGVNAIVNAAKLITRLDERGVKFTPDKLLGDGSLNIGMINGGTAINVVPDECTFKIDGRFVPGQTYDGVIEEIRDIIDELSKEDKNFKAEIDFCSRCTNAVVIPDDSDLVKSLISNSEEVYKKASELGGFIAAGDNCLFHKKGVPALMYGPGTLDCIHKSNEWVCIDELAEAAKIYALTALDLCM